MLNKICTIFIFICLGLSAGVFADNDARTALFSDADNAFLSAKTANAEILSPKNFSKASNIHKSAAERYQKNPDNKRIPEDLAEAVNLYQQALDMVKIAEATFGRGIAARTDAIKANAKDSAPEEWINAERVFLEATQRLEGGNLKKAQLRHDEAEKLYRQAELVAIKSTYLSETRSLIELAKQNKANKYAPETLAKAESLLAQAETGLSENRYDTDQPKALAREAKYEAQHANHIAQKVALVSSKKITMEALLLEMEQPVAKIASSLDMVAVLDGSVEDVSALIREKIASLQADSQELSQRQQEIDELQTELAKLEERLGVQSQRLEKQEEKRNKIESIKRMFFADEAIVFEQGNNIIIRLTSLHFDSGKADINIDNFDLLNKVMRAADTFPTSKILIEGHTDSFGSDQANMDLSRERAVSVRTYLSHIDTKNRTKASMVAQGFGETRPISTNDNAEGRAKNRRIDITMSDI